MRVVNITRKDFPKIVIVFTILSLVLLLYRSGPKKSTEPLIPMISQPQYENLDQLADQIITTSQFQKLKTVEENNPYHDHEKVYDHLMRTYATAKEEIAGDFITDPVAKERYTAYINGEVSGMKRKDLMVTIALLHDIGKILVVKEGETQKSICETRVNGYTSCSGHEYWGSTIVGDVLKDMNFSKEQLAYIAQVIRLHDMYNDSYLNAKKDWPMSQTINDIKARGENTHIEVLFNIYCDNFTTTVFDGPRKQIIEIFNDPELYTQRTYIIP